MTDKPQYTDGEHYYLSTGCFHGQHSYCNAMTGMQGAKRPAQCKFCDAKCICQCHYRAALAEVLAAREAGTGE